MARVRMQLFPNNVVPFRMVALAGRFDLLLEASGGDGRVEARTLRLRRAKRAGRPKWRGWKRDFRRGGH